MNLYPKRSVAGPRLDLLFIAFPLWVPIIYYTIISTIPGSNAILFFFVMLLLGEPHFAATWFFVLNDKNRRWILDNKYFSIFLPLLIATTLICLGLFVSIKAALFPILIFNLFHVTRQSIGVLKLYGDFNSRSLKTALNLVYVFSIFFTLVGLLRFYFQWNITADDLSIITTYSVLAVAVAVVVVSYLSVRDGVSLTFVGTAFTGIAMFIPMLITKSLQDAFAMGVGMHYAQYLAITISLYLRMSKQTSRDSANKVLKVIAPNFFTISVYLFSYAVLMVFLASYKFFAGKFGIYMHTDAALYLIPLTMQAMHFYVDSFIWRFSNPHIRSEIHPFLFMPAPSAK